MSDCSKRAWDSVEAARYAHNRAHFRIRPYRCPRCRKIHVTNAEKDMNVPRVARRRYTSLGAADPRLAPAMTLDELEAEAARRRGAP